LSFIDFINNLERSLQSPLPGNEAHMALTSMRRLRQMRHFTDLTKAINSAVLILLYPDHDGEILTVLIQRPVYDGVHSGQISFPGGKFEPGDADLIQTSLRESKEEVGINPDNVRVMGNLTELYIPPSKMKVLPVLGYQLSVPRFTLDPGEVDKIITLSLRELLNPGNLQKQRVTVGTWSEIVPCFNIRGNIIWGATAMILNELKTIIQPIQLPG
jgi:8-oxo-dGTP pyrophosphatase MutT (NUDIX family)